MIGNLEPVAVIFLALVFLVGAMVNGLLGFGLPLVVLNAMATVIDPKAGVVVMSMVAPFLSTYQLIHNWSLIPAWRRVGGLIGGAVVGSVVGAQLLVLLPTWAIGLALGLFTVQFAVDRLRRERTSVSTRTERRLGPLVGFAGGTTNSAIGASGPIYGTYLYAIGLRGREFAVGISLVFTIQSLVRVSSYAVLGQLTIALASLAAVLLLPSLIGQHLGQLSQGRANPLLFQRILLVVLLISSVNLLVQGGRGMLAWLGVRL